MSADGQLAYHCGTKAGLPNPAALALSKTGPAGTRVTFLKHTRSWYQNEERHGRLDSQGLQELATLNSYAENGLDSPFARAISKRVLRVDLHDLLVIDMDVGGDSFDMTGSDHLPGGTTLAGPSVIRSLHSNFDDNPSDEAPPIGMPNAVAQEPSMQDAKPPASSHHNQRQPDASWVQDQHRDVLSSGGAVGLGMDSKDEASSSAARKMARLPPSGAIGRGVPAAGAASAPPAAGKPPPSPHNMMSMVSDGVGNPNHLPGSIGQGVPTPGIPEGGAPWPYHSGLDIHMQKPDPMAPFTGGDKAQYYGHSTWEATAQGNSHQATTPTPPHVDLNRKPAARPTSNYPVEAYSPCPAMTGPASHAGTPDTTRRGNYISGQACKAYGSNLQSMTSKGDAGRGVSDLSEISNELKDFDVTNMKTGLRKNLVSRLLVILRVQEDKLRRKASLSNIEVNVSEAISDLRKKLQTYRKHGTVGDGDEDWDSLMEGYIEDFVLFCGTKQDAEIAVSLGSDHMKSMEERKKRKEKEWADRERDQKHEMTNHILRQIEELLNANNSNNNSGTGGTDSGNVKNRLSSIEDQLGRIEGKMDTILSLMKSM